MAVEIATKLNVDQVEEALDGLLNVIHQDEARQRAARTGLPRFELVSLADLRAETLPTRAENEILQLARDPIGAACRQAIRLCGEELHRRGGFDLMSVILERVADMDSRRYGARATIMDHAWNGIGGVWWS